MIRKSFVMNVFEQYYEEYEKRHEELWPELKEAIFTHGATSYSIFLLKDTGQLFGYLEIESEGKWAELANTEICKKWWDYMEPLMETNPDNSPVTIDLTCVFHISK